MRYVRWLQWPVRWAVGGIIVVVGYVIMFMAVILLAIGALLMKDQEGEKEGPPGFIGRFLFWLAQAGTHTARAGLVVMGIEPYKRLE